MQGAVGYERWMPELVELIGIRSVGAGSRTRERDGAGGGVARAGGLRRSGGTAQDRARPGAESVVVADVAAAGSSPSGDPGDLRPLRRATGRRPRTLDHTAVRARDPRRLALCARAPSTPRATS